MKYDECIDYIKRNNVSLARMGDGELICMNGKDLNFQKSSPEIRKSLKRVCGSCSDKCLIGIPDCFEDLDRYCQIEQDFWRVHLYFWRRHWFRFLRKDARYANTFMSRFYSMEIRNWPNKGSQNYPHCGKIEILFSSKGGIQNWV